MSFIYTSLLLKFTLTITKNNYSICPKLTSPGAELAEKERKTETERER